MVIVKLIIILGIILSTPAIIAAQSDNSTARPERAVSFEGPKVTLRIIDPEEKIMVWSNLRLGILVESRGAQYGVDDIRLAVPTDLALKYRGSQRNDNETDMISIGDTFELAPGQSKPFLIELKAKPFRELGASFLAVLTFTPTKEIMVAKVNYKGEQDEPLESFHQLEINVKAHPLGMYAGAVLGAFLSALLILLISIQKEPDRKLTRLVQLVGGFFFSFVIGVVATAIAILIFQTTSDFTFPVAIKVRDFYGGVLLGLFGEKVALSLYQRLSNGNGPKPVNQSVV
jgi:hypothetical protein